MLRRTNISIPIISCGSSSSSTFLWNSHRRIVVGTSSTTAATNTTTTKHLLQICDSCSDILPHQSILKNFVHHNPLSTFENLSFTDAQEHLHQLESFSSPGERAFMLFGVDPRKRVNESLSELSSAFLDRGAAKWTPPENLRKQGFLRFFASLEHLGYAPWRSHARLQSSRILDHFKKINNNTDNNQNNNNSSSFSENENEDSILLSCEILNENLRSFGFKQEEYGLAIRSMLKELRGWAGMYHRMQTHPDEAPDNTIVRLIDFAVVMSILTRSSIEAQIRGQVPASANLVSLSSWLKLAPTKQDLLHRVDLIKEIDDEIGNNKSLTPEERDILFVQKQQLDEEELHHQQQLIREHHHNNNISNENNDHHHHPSTLPPSPTSSSITQRRERYSATRESAIASFDQTGKRQKSLETEFKHTLLNAIGDGPVSKTVVTGRPHLQLFTCIDDREGSLRRRFEEQSPQHFESFGVPGFFGLPIFYENIDGSGTARLAPVGLIPKHTLVEKVYEPDQKNFIERTSRRKMLAQAQILWEKSSFFPFTSIAVSCVAWPFTIARLALMSLAPLKLHELKTQFYDKILPPTRTTFDLVNVMPFEDAARMLSTLLKDVGLNKPERFARICIVAGHGSSSANNPFFSAYNCGACSGGQGGPNARLFARVANDPQVRKLIFEKEEFGNIQIPDDTLFVGCLHNTCNDTCEFFDVDLHDPEHNNNNNKKMLEKKYSIPDSHQEDFEKAIEVLKKACGENALERCYRFLSATYVKSTEEAMQHCMERSVDPAQVRPELNHATNAAVVIGRRSLTANKFLDRRVFMPSYDPFNDDERGTNLEHMMAPALVVCSGINLEYLFSTVRAESMGCGTKAPLNIVGNIGVLQGTTGNLRVGLPTQMTEMHTPIRELFIIDAPVARAEAVLSRRPELAKLIRNEWVRFVCRDPYTNEFWIHRDKKEGGGYEKIVPRKNYSSTTETENKNNNSTTTAITTTPERELETTNRKDWTMVHFERHKNYAVKVTQTETTVFNIVVVGLGLSLLAPFLSFGGLELLSTNPRGCLIATCGTCLSLPVLTFARRYLHGEHLFVRFSFLMVGLVVSFNMVATAPTLAHMLPFWSLFGFASTFLIGSYNDRPTVRNNAVYAFAAYRIGDIAMICACAFSSPAVAATYAFAPQLTAASLIIAVFFKSAQFPMTAIFARSMEGPTISSALGYAGISAHIGVVLLVSTMDLWFGFDWARMWLAAVGGTTAVTSTLCACVRSDRKGSIAYATSATVGLIFVVLASGHTNVALLMCLGNASLRITQILRAPSILADTLSLQSALRAADVLSNSNNKKKSSKNSNNINVWSQKVPDFLYRLAWGLRRFDSDFHLMHLLEGLMTRFKFVYHPFFHRRRLSREQQWFLTFCIVVISGFPFTPMMFEYEHFVIHLIEQGHPVQAAAMLAAHFGLSVMLIRLLFWKVLDNSRFSLKRLMYRKRVSSLDTLKKKFFSKKN